jgi:UDP-glucuronate decarboxylase
MRRIGNKRVLVTGGAGFLGSHLCERLLADGAEVICLDNFYTGSKSNIIHLVSNPMFTVLEHDVTNPLYLQVDEIYNLACPASPVHYQYDPVHTTKTSVMGTINMLGLAKRVNAKILHASTSEVYGDPEVHPQPESYWGHVNPTGIRSCYDEGKRCAETLCFDYNRRHGLEVKVVRIFNTYGPRMHPDDGRVVSNFVVQALMGEPITLYGDGSQTRSFCYVDDLIEGFVRMMATPSDVIGPINLGNPGEFTIRELAHEVLAISGSTSPLVERDLPADDPRQRQPDISRARELLGWEPQIPLAEGLVQTIEHFAKLLGKAAAPQRPAAVFGGKEDVQRAGVARGA